MKASLGSAQISCSDVALGAGLSPVAAREQGQTGGGGEHGSPKCRVDPVFRIWHFAPHGFGGSILILKKNHCIKILIILITKILEGFARSLGRLGLGEAQRSPSLLSPISYATWKLHCAFDCLPFGLQNRILPGVHFLPISLFSLQNCFLFFFLWNTTKWSIIRLNHQQN